MPAHHQHDHLELGILELVDLALDAVDGSAQAAFEPGLLVEAEPLSFLDHRGEAGLIGLQRRIHRVDLLRQLGLAERCDLAAERLDVERHLPADLDLSLRPGRIAAQQKILLGAARLEQLDRDPVVQLEHGARILGRVAIDAHPPLAVEVNAADQDDADDPNDADRGDLVSESQGEEPHRELSWW
ncbi:hypothetical protein ABH992_002569 [Bradyrhizobium yuanmingense]|uniref:Uncharacterized protein n=1 Tax=Bradyrhizobium yuanmingense TaxID=108015 RepID=A0ABV4GE26_9BRAD